MNELFERADQSTRTRTGIEWPFHVLGHAVIAADVAGFEQALPAALGLADDRGVNGGAGSPRR
jgi:hypothetical protein